MKTEILIDIWGFKKFPKFIDDLNSVIESECRKQREICAESYNSASPRTGDEELYERIVNAPSPIKEGEHEN